jgi:hypothetical protein
MIDRLPDNCCFSLFLAHKLTRKCALLILTENCTDQETLLAYTEGLTFALTI